MFGTTIALCLAVFGTTIALCLAVFGTTIAMCLAAVNDFSVFRLWCCIPGLFVKVSLKAVLKMQQGQVKTLHNNNDNNKNSNNNNNNNDNNSNNNRI